MFLPVLGASCKWNWTVISLSITSSGFIHGIAGVRVSFLFKAEWHFIVWMDHILFCTHLGCFHLLAVVNSTAVNLGTQILWGPVFRGISGSGVAGLYGCSTDSACRLQFLYPSLTLVIFYFLIVAVLMGIRWFSLWSWFAFFQLLVMLSFHILFGHLYMIFEEMSVQVFYPFLSWVI